MNIIKISALTIFLLIGNSQFSNASDACDSIPLGPRIDSIMAKNFPKLISWRDGQGEKRFTGAPKKSLELFREGLSEIDRIRAATCADLGESRTSTKAPLTETKSCPNVIEALEEAQNTVSLNNKYLAKVTENEAKLPFIFDAYFQGGMDALNEAITLTNPEIIVFNEAVREVAEVWIPKSDPAKLFGREGTIFFAIQKAKYTSASNEAKVRYNKLQIIEMELGCN